MVTKAQRSKSQERIDRAKRKYRIADTAADSLLARLARSPHTAAILIVLALCVLGLWLA